jgi:hypothetical protein
VASLTAGRRSGKPRGDISTQYDIGSELLDRAILAEAFLCDEVEKLLP